MNERAIMDSSVEVLKPSPMAVEDVNPARKLHSYLRGRYRWTVLLGLLLGALGGFAAYRSWEPKYKSTGLIRIEPVLPRIIYRSEQSTMLPMYDAYVGSQMALLQSQRVTDLAMQDRDWKAMKRGLSDEDVRKFNQSLLVYRRSQIIYISFIDDDLRAAMVAVESVIDAYMHLFGAHDQEREQMRFRFLTERKSRLSNEIKILQNQIRNIAEEHGSDDLESAYVFRLELLQQVESRLKDIQMQMWDLEVVARNTEGKPRLEELTPTQIAATERIMQEYYGQRAALDLNLARLKIDRRDHHQSVKNVQKQIEMVNDLIADYANRYNAARIAVAKDKDGNNAGAPISNKLTLLKARERQFTKIYEQEKEETMGLGRTRLQIDKWKEEINLVKQLLKQTDDRLEQLTVESSVPGRITVISKAERPVSPINLGKRRQLVAFASVGGFTLGVGLFLGIGMVDRRYRYVEDAHESIGHLRLLGILPQLPRDLGDPEQAANVAHAVHHIRTLLQLHGNSDHPSIFAVTSGMPGDGKTSLVMALGLSFAASGSRTLLIDLDITGQGLTTQAESIVRRRMGQVLLRESLVTAPQLAEGLELASRSHCRLGEALMKLGFLTKNDVDQALSIQLNGTVGLPEVLEGEDLQLCVHETDRPLLSILPVGAAKTELIGSLSPASMGHLLHQAKRQFHTVLVDTGPLPASIEASLVAVQADGVVVTVSHGTSRRAAERALTHLASIGANVLGLVFNRANARDQLRYGRSSLVSGSRPRSSGLSVPRHIRTHSSSRGSASTQYGPVASATARCLPVPKAGNGRGDEPPAIDVPSKIKGNAQPEHAPTLMDHSR